MKSNLHIKRGLKGEPDLIRQLLRDRRLLIVTDRNVSKLYLHEFRAYLEQALIFEIEPGEQSKSFETLQALYQYCADVRLSRDDYIFALGGGVVGDLAGLLAATWKRGCHLVQIPTSLLAMVDSSVGGKSAIDFAGQKNIIGCFYPAETIYVDPEYLLTLPLRHLKNGLAEIIKIAAVFDPSLLDQIATLPTSITDDLDLLTDIIKRAIDLKQIVVDQDPYDQKGCRALLNYGHTLGHALEAWSLQQDRSPLLHGEAISIGMALLDGDPRGLLQHFDLPCQPPKGLTAEDLLPYLIQDKKCHGQTLSFIRLPSLGSPQIEQRPIEALRGFIEALLARAHRIFGE